MKKEDSIVNFNITKSEINQFKELYVSEKICDFGNQMVYDNYNSIMPVTTVTYSIKLSDNSNQIIAIKSDFRSNPCQTKELEKLEKLKKFINKINKFLKHKKEIQNLPMSDYIVL